MRQLVVVACAMVVLVAGAATHASGQPPAAAGPHFEVASIKASPSPYEIARAAGASGGRISFPIFGVRVQPGGRLVGNTNLQSLILRAYGIREYQLEGGPKWLTTDYFDISAKAEQETATETELNVMLRSLLAERFALRVHAEIREAPVHTLTMARADSRLGPGLKPTSKECEATLAERKRTGAVPPRPSGPPALTTPTCGMMNMMGRNSAATITIGGQAISTLVNQISSELAGPVVDRTGLTGLFDVVLEYEVGGRLAGSPAGGLDPNSTDPLPVPLPAALQQQLGLKLEKGTGPLPITIIDAVEQPSPN